jgi:hypothetical protein
MKGQQEHLVFPVVWNEYYSDGIRKRELYAAMALQGMLSGESHYRDDALWAAKRAVTFADALLDELSR